MAICAEIKRGTPTVLVESLDNLLDLFRNEEVKRKITAYREGLQQVCNRSPCLKRMVMSHWPIKRKRR